MSVTARHVSRHPASGTGEHISAEELGRVHLVGIGGIGMSGLARLLLSRGVPISGSELKDWPALAGLRALGGTIHMRHQASNLDGADTVVYSSAIPADHVELVEARARGLRILHRSEALAAAMVGRQTVAVAGTHGKTTTTSMVTAILRHAGLDPSYVIGGELAAGNAAPSTEHPERGTIHVGAGERLASGAAGVLEEGGSNAHDGTGPHFIIEADEHDRSFLNYRPDIAVITNIDADHLNTYGDLAGLAEAFLAFGTLVGPSGLVVTCADDPLTRELADRARAAGLRVETYGEAADATLHISDLRSDAGTARYRAQLSGEDLGEITLAMPGRHLGLNSAAAVLVAVRLGVPVRTVAEALAGFAGVRRRFERKGEVGGIRVYDEYAYHPTAMTAALRTLRDVAGAVPERSGREAVPERSGREAVPERSGREAGRLLVVFQPYRVYRTRDLRAEIAAALALADEVVVMEVFGPGESRGPGDGGIALHAAIDLPAERKIFVASWEDVPGEVVARARFGDVVVTMGAPPISLMGDELLAALTAARNA